MVERLECPDCQLQTVERRASNLPRYVKLRKVDGVHDTYVCRNSECKWTGGANDLAETEQTGPDYEHGTATNWTETKPDGGTMKQEKRQKQIEVSPSRGFGGDDEVVELQADDVEVVSDDGRGQTKHGTAVVPMSREQAERVRDEIDAALGVLVDGE